MKRDIQRLGGWRTTSVANTLLILPLRFSPGWLWLLFFCPRRKKPVKCDQLVAGCFLPWSRWLSTNGDKKKKERKRGASSRQKARASCCERRERWEEKKKGRGRRRAVPLCENCFRSGPIQSTFSIGSKIRLTLHSLPSNQEALSNETSWTNCARQQDLQFHPCPSDRSGSDNGDLKSWQLKLGIYSRLRGSLSTAWTWLEGQGSEPWIELLGFE